MVLGPPRLGSSEPESSIQVPAECISEEPECYVEQNSGGFDYSDAVGGNCYIVVVQMPTKKPQN